MRGSRGVGVTPPPLEFAKLNIADITENEKNNYFSYLRTSAVICEGWSPPGKIFWIRAYRWFVKFDSLNSDALKFCKNTFIMFMLINFILSERSNTDPLHLLTTGPLISWLV